MQQGFELRYDLVLQFSHAASGGRLQLGPPDKQLLSTAAIESALQGREDNSKRRIDAALFIQVWSRSRAVRRAGGARAEVVASAQAVAGFGRQRGRLDRTTTEAKLLKAALQPEESAFQLCRRKCVGCLKRLFFRVAAPIRRASADAKRVPSPSGRTRRRRWSQERREERLRTTLQRASEQQEILEALRLAHIDYVLVRPFGDDRVFACLTASLATLQARAVAVLPCCRSARAPPPPPPPTTTKPTSPAHQYPHPTHLPNSPQAHAEDIELHARLRRFPEGRERELHEGTNCVPRVPFTAKRYPADFCLFRSRERCARRSHPHAHACRTCTARARASARASAPHLHRICTASAPHLQQVRAALPPARGARRARRAARPGGPQVQRRPQGLLPAAPPSGAGEAARHSPQPSLLGPTPSADQGRPMPPPSLPLSSPVVVRPFPLAWPCA